MTRVCLTGGIACGKSLLSRFLNEFGFETIDADDIVHDLIPPDERRRLARIVFADPSARSALEARIHPLVKARLLAAPEKIAVIPLLFEVHWDGEYDIICCVTSSRENQIDRMMSRRGLSREEAEARLAAQLPVEMKAAKSHYVIDNNASAEELREKARTFTDWLRKEKEKRDGRGKS